MSIYSILSLIEAVGYTADDFPVMGDVGIILLNDDMVSFSDRGDYVVVYYTARGQQVGKTFSFIKNVRVETENPSQYKRVLKFMEKIS